MKLEFSILIEVFYDNGPMSRFYIVLWTRSLDGLNMSESIVTRNKNKSWRSNWDIISLLPNSILNSDVLSSPLVYRLRIIVVLKTNYDFKGWTSYFRAHSDLDSMRTDLPRAHFSSIGCVESTIPVFLECLKKLDLKK